MKFYLALIVLIAFAAGSAFSQEIDCTEEFFRVVRDEEQCQNFAVCMVGGRVNFSCDDGDIFDPEAIACRPAYPDTCDFAEVLEPYQKIKPLSEFL